MSILKAKHQIYTPQEVHTLFKMMEDEGSRELAIDLIKNSKKRFLERDRVALYKELNHLIQRIDGAYYRWGTMKTGGTINWHSVTYRTSYGYTTGDQQLLENVKKVQFQHSKRSYSTAEWQKNNWKKEYRRSAKNHYS